MEARINQTELELLAFLHENAKGYDRHFDFNISEIEKPLEWERDTLYKAVSYLNQWGLISITSWSGGNTIVRICLTGAGEAYMRNVDAEMENNSLIQHGKRLTVALIKSGGTAMLPVAISAFTEYAKAWLPSIASNFQAMLNR